MIMNNMSCFLEGNKLDIYFNYVPYPTQAWHILDMCLACVEHIGLHE